MTELTSIDEIGEWLDQRELYMEAHLIKRKHDEDSGEVASTYLAMAVSAAPDRYGQRPVVTSADGIPVRWPAPAWSADPCGVEPPLGFSIDELPALGGASGPLPDTEVTRAPVSGGRESGHGRQR
jgi:hypothetical protein